MKNILLIMLILFSTNCFGQEIIDEEVIVKEIIDVNYSKYLKITSMYLDENQDKTVNDSEFRSFTLANAYIILDYKDFRSAGNILDVIVNINDKIKFKKRYQDIILYRAYYHGINYIAKNKYNEILFMIIANSNESKDYFLVIHDLTILGVE